MTEVSGSRGASRASSPEFRRFLERLKGLNRRWYLLDGERIRSEGPDRSRVCPITAVAGRGGVDWADAGTLSLAGLWEPGLSGAIARAADRDDDGDPEIRAELLRACKLHGGADGDDA